MNHKYSKILCSYRQLWSSNTDFTLFLLVFKPQTCVNIVLDKLGFASPILLLLSVVGGDSKTFIPCATFLPGPGQIGCFTTISFDYLLYDVFSLPPLIS